MVGWRGGGREEAKRVATALPRRCASMRWTPVRWCRSGGGRRDGGPGGPSVRISIIDSAECSCRIRAAFRRARVFARRCARVYSGSVVIRSPKSARARARPRCVCVRARAHLPRDPSAGGRPSKLARAPASVLAAPPVHSAIGARDVRTCRARDVWPCTASSGDPRVDKREREQRSSRVRVDLSRRNAWRDTEERVTTSVCYLPTAVRRKCAGREKERDR